MWGEKGLKFWSPFFSTYGLIVLHPVWLGMGTSFCPAQLNDKYTEQESGSLLSVHNPCTGSFAAARLLLERCPLSQDPMQVARLLWKIWAKDYIWKCCTKHNSVSADSPIFSVSVGDRGKMLGCLSLYYSSEFYALHL